ncbi:unnamed protein product, partial [Onchocerca ochengi]
HSFAKCSCKSQYKAEVGRLAIQPSSSAGSPRNIHEYAQDAIAHVHYYGQPIHYDHMQSARDDMQNLLLPRQSPMHRHVITARVFI